MPVSDSYYESLIESLKDPSYAAVYLETHLEGDEYGFDPELLKLALSHVLEALCSQVMTREQIPLNEHKFKELVKQAFRELIQEDKEFLFDLVTEMIEDIGLVKAIQQGENTESVSQDEIFKLFNTCI